MFVLTFKTILVVFYKYAVKYIPGDTIRIPLKVFSRAGPEGMIRLPTTDEEATRMGETFLDDERDSDDIANRPQFRDDDDDDIPPPASSNDRKKFIRMTENEEDVFSVSDGEEEEEEARPSGQDEGTKAWQTSD